MDVFGEGGTPRVVIGVDRQIQTRFCFGFDRPYEMVNLIWNFFVFTLCGVPGYKLRQVSTWPLRLSKGQITLSML